MIRSIRSRLDYYGASSDPSRLIPQYNVATMGVPSFRSVRSVEELRRRPNALRTGVGNLRRVGMGQPYTSGVGRPLIEVEDLGNFPDEEVESQPYRLQRTHGSDEEEE